MRLIDADILKGYFLKDAGPHPTEVMWGYWAIEPEIDSCPTVDAEPVKHGRWIEQEAGNLDTYYTCSACKEDFCLIEGEPSDNLWNYCPNCGAKMDEVEANKTV